MILARPVAIAVLIVLATSVAYTQRQATADTAASNPVFSRDTGRATGNASLFLPQSLPFELSFDEPSLFDYWKRTSLKPPLLGSLAEPKADLMAPLRDQWAREDRMSTIRNVLGTVQISAVGYLAYRALTSKETPKPIKRK
jgi:hypothetical protein